MLSEPTSGPEGTSAGRHCWQRQCHSNIQASATATVPVARDQEAAAFQVKRRGTDPDAPGPRPPGVTGHCIPVVQSISATVTQSRSEGTWRLRLSRRLSAEPLATRLFRQESALVASMRADRDSEPAVAWFIAPLRRRDELAPRLHRVLEADLAARTTRTCSSLPSVPMRRTHRADMHSAVLVIGSRS